MLVAENITKRFAGVIALNQVCLEFPAGQVTAVIGENGAGKSTLMKILSGVYPDYEGQLYFKGQPVRFASIRDAQACGIAENLFLGRELTTDWGLLDQKQMRRKTQELLTRLKLDLAPDTLVGELKVGQQQVVEIAKALLEESEVIIMDEPTSAISESEVEVLFGLIRDLRREGKAVVYISHKLDELFAIADRYVVLRDGHSIESGPMAGMKHDDIIRKMVGRDIIIIRQQAGKTCGDPVVTVEDLCLRHPSRPKEKQLKNLSFCVGKGEIVGLFGLMGAGRTELLETLFGLHHGRASGRVWVEGQETFFTAPIGAIKAGLALVPEDRKRDGLVLGLDVQTNISLADLGNVEKTGLLNGVKEALLARKYITDLRIKTPSEKQEARNLSGGNQQKIVLSKWLATNPRLLMLDEPTRGIDINAKNEIYKLMLQLADAGMGILVASSELPEILAVSDRVLVLSEGRITAEFSAAEATENAILKAAIPTTI